MEKEKYKQLNMEIEKMDIEMGEVELQNEATVTNSPNLREALLKRAVGYVTEERIDEFAMDLLTSNLKLIKRRVVQREVPPDVAAAKLLMEVYNADLIEQMSDDELEQEKQRLLKLLKQEEIKEDDNADKE